MFLADSQYDQFSADIRLSTLVILSKIFMGYQRSLMELLAKVVIYGVLLLGLPDLGRPQDLLGQGILTVDVSSSVHAFTLLG